MTCRHCFTRHELCMLSRVLVSVKKRPGNTPHKFVIERRHFEQLCMWYHVIPPQRDDRERVEIGAVSNGTSPKRRVIHLEKTATKGHATFHHDGIKALFCSFVMSIFLLMEYFVIMVRTPYNYTFFLLELTRFWDHEWVSETIIRFSFLKLSEWVSERTTDRAYMWFFLPGLAIFQYYQDRGYKKRALFYTMTKMSEKKGIFRLQEKILL